MSAGIALEPLFPNVELHLASGPQDMLSLITRTAAALEAAQETEAADAFARCAQTCIDEDELLHFIAALITVI